MNLIKMVKKIKKKKSNMELDLMYYFLKKIDENKTFKTGNFIMSLSKTKFIKRSIFSALLKKQMKNTI